MKRTAVPTNLTEHLTKSWPERKSVSHHAVVFAGELGSNPSEVLGQVESDVTVQVAIGLTHDQWVMLISSGPRWWICVDARSIGEAGTRQAWRLWDRDREPLSSLPGETILKCEISGYAVPTFLDTTLWSLPEDESALPWQR